MFVALVEQKLPELCRQMQHKVKHMLKFDKSKEHLKRGRNKTSVVNF
jgi:hypothetical protein